MKIFVTAATKQTQTNNNNDNNNNGNGRDKDNMANRVTRVQSSAAP